MPHHRRKSTPKVRGGKVQRKNRSARTPTIYTWQGHLVVDKEKPGRGYKHLAGKWDVRRFLGILPQWDELSGGLNTVLLAEGGYGCMGWHRPGIVAICAWDREIVWDDCDQKFYRGNKRLFDKLDVECRPNGKEWYIDWTESKAKAFSLIDVLVHELGHHHDRMTTRSKRRTARGEPYAEAYARRWEDTILERYFEVFGLP